MTVTLSYDPSISRVQVAATGLSTAVYAIVERSTDGIRWTTVRGAGAVPVVAGALAVPVSDFEFPSSGLPITYRVTAINSTPASYVGVGTGSAGSSGSRTPALPAGIVAGNVLLLLASTRNSGTGTPDTPAGWDLLAGTGNLRLFGRVWDGVFAAPTVTFTGGAANEDTLAQIAAFRQVTLNPVFSTIQLNSAAQNIAFAGQSTLPQLGMLVLYVGWKADDWTSVATITPGFTVEISELTSTAGNDAGQVWNYYFPATTAAINPGSFVVTGGGSAISRGGTVVLQHSNTVVAAQTATITPNIGAVWLKSISRPFLNRPVDTRLASTIAVSRKSRAAVFQVLGRSVPIAVSSVRGSREWTMLVRTEGAADRDNTELLLASGDVLFIQAPPDCGVETGYVSVGDTTREAHPLRPLSWLFTMPMTEVAQPSPEVVGAVGTWQSVINQYGDWSGVLADRVSWAELLAIVGDPTEIVVP